jgi:hypothetical protein
LQKTLLSEGFDSDEHGRIVSGSDNIGADANLGQLSNSHKYLVSFIHNSHFQMNIIASNNQQVAEQFPCPDSSEFGEFYHPPKQEDYSAFLILEMNTTGAP